MSTVQGILQLEGATLSYLVSGIVMTMLVAVALWWGRRAVGGRATMSLFTAVAAFLLSRVLLFIPEQVLVQAELGRVLGFSVLSFVGLYFLVLSFVGILRAGEFTSAAPAKTDDNRPLRRINLQVLYFALFGALVFLIRGPGGAVPQLIVGIANAMLIAASVRLVIFFFSDVSRIPGALKPIALGASCVLVCAWALAQAAPLMSESTAEMLRSAVGLLDIVTLFLILMGLITNYVRLSHSYRVKAVESIEQMDTAKAELTKLSKIATNIYEDSSDLIKKQKDQTFLYMKKVENLEKILEIGNTIQRRNNLEELLQMIVELVRDNVGFKTVILRLFNARSQNFETQAYVGLAEEMRDTVVNYRIPREEYEKMLEPRFRMSRSYFIRNSNPWYGEDLSPDESVLVEDTWGEIDMLIVPLVGDDGSSVGYLSVENPEDPKLSVADVIENLEVIASLAVVAIRNARVFKELERKNRKLRVYAEKLSSLNKLKSNFVATISHEFRTPLTSIKAYCDTLLKNADDVDRELLKQFLIVIDEESSRLMTLIEDILDFSQMESGAMKFERTRCNVTELVDQAAEELRKNFESRHITLHSDVPQQGVMVQAEGELMKQLLINLLHNASKFTKEGGNVWLKLEDDTGSVRVTVEDEGIGIPNDQLEKIFEQFHQVDNSSTRQYGGSGLGLAICRNIIEWHDGRIWVENVPGKGARFVAVIPKKQVIVKCHVMNMGSTMRRFEVERFLELLVENIAEFLNVRKASIMLIDRVKNELRIESAIGLDEEVVEHGRVKLGEGISGKVAQENRTMLVTDIETDARVARSNNELAYGSKSFLSVPIRSDGRVVGVINVASPISKKSLDDDDSRLLEVLVERLSIAIKKLGYFADASIVYEEVRDTLKAILEAKRYIDAKDDTYVTWLVVKTAEKLGIDDDALSRLRYILNVYDLGLSRVGYHIIKNPNELSMTERKEIEKHTLFGMDMLSVIETGSAVCDVVRSHHENFDGSGYPGELKGEDIPLEARIIRVADSMRALVSQRPYQRQYSFEEAMEVIKHRSGSFFDPAVVDAFTQAIEESKSEAESEGLGNTKTPDKTIEELS